MSGFKPYKSRKRPVQGQQRSILLNDQERDYITKMRFVDLFGLDLWEECSRVRTHAEMHSLFLKIGLKYC